MCRSLFDNISLIHDYFVVLAKLLNKHTLRTVYDLIVVWALLIWCYRIELLYEKHRNSSRILNVYHCRSNSYLVVLLGQWWQSTLLRAQLRSSWEEIGKRFREHLPEQERALIVSSIQLSISRSEMVLQFLYILLAHNLFSIDKLISKERFIVSLSPGNESYETICVVSSKAILWICRFLELLVVQYHRNWFFILYKNVITVFNFLLIVV